MVIKHTKKIWTFLGHFFTYLKFYVHFNVAEIRIGSRIFFSLFLRGRVPFHFFIQAGNMERFSFSARLVPFVMAGHYK